MKAYVLFTVENLIELGNSNMKKDSSLESFTQLNLGSGEEVSDSRKQNEFQKNYQIQTFFSPIQMAILQHLLNRHLRRSYF